MNRLNQKTDYAVRVLLALAKRPEGARVPTAVISQWIRVDDMVAAALGKVTFADLAQETGEAA